MNAPIRVLELRSVWGTGGGPDKTILNGAALMDPSRVAVTVCYVRDLRDTVFSIDTRARALGLDFVEVLERHSLDYRIWPQLTRLVRAKRIDIVHAHDHKTDALAWALWMRLRIIPLSTAHGFSGYTRREQVYYAIEKRILARFPRVIAVAGHIRDELCRTGSAPERVTVINNGIDHTTFVRQAGLRNAQRASLALRDTDIAIGAVGRLEREKRFDLLLDAFAAVHAKFPSSVLLIAGEGSLRLSLEQAIAEKGLVGAARLVGQVSDVAAFHSALDLFVQSSEREGTPNAVLEAMALETPVVATDVGGTRELLTNGVHGLLTPRNDSRELRDAMLACLTDPAAARIRAAAARQRIETELSFSTRMLRVQRVYEELMATSRG